MRATENGTNSAAKLSIHQLLVNRIVTRAVVEGAPITPIQIQQFESDAMSKEQRRAFSKEFDRENDWQEFLDRIGSLLRRAIAEDAEKDPQAPDRYDAMVHQLEDRPESFTLWACCVPAISGYKSKTRWQLTDVVVLLFVLAVIFTVILHLLKKL